MELQRWGLQRSSCNPSGAASFTIKEVFTPPDLLSMSFLHCAIISSTPQVWIELEALTVVVNPLEGQSVRALPWFDFPCLSVIMPTSCIHFSNLPT